MVQVNLNSISKEKLIDHEISSNIVEAYIINDNIGYVLIIDSNINKIFININKEHRGKGYATAALKKILKKFQGELIFETNNPIVYRMLINEGGINVANTNGTSRIVLYIKNIEEK